MIFNKIIGFAHHLAQQITNNRSNIIVILRQSLELNTKLLQTICCYRQIGRKGRKRELFTQAHLQAPSLQTYTVLSAGLAL